MENLTITIPSQFSEPSITQSVNESSATQPVEESFSLNEKLIFDLVDAYVGVQSVPVGRGSLKEIDSVHKEYFKAFLKENSLNRALVGLDSFKSAYQEFYLEQCVDNSKNSSGLVSKLFSSKKLLEEDTLFFNGLEKISMYSKGETVDKIEEEVDFVFNHRLSYLNPISSEEQETLVKSVKANMMRNRYGLMTSKFSSDMESKEGADYALSRLDNFIDDAFDLFKDFKIEDIPVNFKKAIFNIAYDNYSKIFLDKNNSDYGKIVFAFNNVHKKIFGNEKEIIKLEFDDEGVSYKRLNNPYVLMSD